MDFFSKALKLLPDFLQGAVVSLQITGIGLMIGIALGLITAIIRVYAPWGIKWIAFVYTELFRGTPLLVQLFIVYYALPQLNIKFSPIIAAYLVLGLNSGAYQSEYFRGAIQAIGSGQMTAGRALGLSKWESIVNIILPQAIRLVIPAWSNEPIALLKASAVVYLIPVIDLMKKVDNAVSATYDAFTPYIVAAIIYLAIVMILSLLLELLEKKMQIPGYSLETQRSH